MSWNVDRIEYTCDQCGKRWATIIANGHQQPAGVKIHTVNDKQDLCAHCNKQPNKEQTDGN